MSMKVAVYQDELSPYREDLFKRVSEYDVVVHLIIGGPPVNRPYWARRGKLRSSNRFKKIFLSSARLNFGAYTEYFSPRIIQLFRREKYDVVHIPHGMITGPLLLCAARRNNSLTISGTGVSFFSLTPARIFGEPLVRLSTLLSDYFIAYSKYAKKYLVREMADPRRIMVIPNGVDTERFSPNTRSGNLIEELGILRKKVVLFVGRLEKEKGIDCLVRAMSIVKKNVPNSHLLIVGNGSLRMYLENLVQELQIEDSVSFVGPVSSEKIPKYYAVCDVHAAPSIVTKTFIEPFGMVYIEAMASGKPSVAFDIPAAVRDVIVDGRTGYLVPEKNVSVLADRICELLQNEKKRRRMGIMARERAVENYAMDVISRKWAEAFTRVLDCRK